MKVSQLIKKSQEGDKGAFGELVLMYGDYVFSVVFRIINNQEDSEDLAQDVFVKAWKNIKAFDETKSKFTTWLYTISIRMALSYLKTRNKNIELVDKISNYDNTEMNIDLIELGKRIEQATQSLSDQQKIVFVLRDLEELPVDEVVEITGFSEKKIKDNLYIARKRVKEKLSKLLKVK
nr:RNA polymerase sigma factor [uncultured Carboxylicivirga sp.]